MYTDDPEMMAPNRVIPLISVLTVLSACAAPDISDWPPDPIAASDEVVQRYVDRYALKESAPKAYTDIELQALQILQERTRYETRQRAYESSSDFDPDDSNASENSERSRNEINAIKRRVYRRYESSHDRRHELRSKYRL